MTEMLVVEDYSYSKEYAVEMLTAWDFTAETAVNEKVIDFLERI